MTNGQNSHKQKREEMRGKTMIGALVREINGTGIMKVVLEYKCDNKGEYILFPGEKDNWLPLENFEILSLG